MFLSYFDMPAAAAVAAMVAALDDGDAELAAAGPPSSKTEENGCPSAAAASPAAVDCFTPVAYSRIRDALVAAFDGIFDNSHGALITAMRTEPSRFLYPRPAVRRWLERARGVGGGRRRYHTFLATNSSAPYANVVLDYALGPGWAASCFDVVCYDALKPAWFNCVQPWYAVDDVSGKDGARLASMEIGGLGVRSHHHPSMSVGADGGSGNSEAQRLTTSVVEQPSLGAPPIIVVRGHAGGIQALADAVAAVAVHHANGGGGSEGGSGVGGCIAAMPGILHLNEVGEGVGAPPAATTTASAHTPVSTVRLRVDSRGHVTRVDFVTGDITPAQSSAPAEKGASPSLRPGDVFISQPSSAEGAPSTPTTPAAHTSTTVRLPLPIRGRVRKPSVDAAAAAWLAHGTGSAPATVAAVSSTNGTAPSLPNGTAEVVAAGNGSAARVGAAALANVTPVTSDRLAATSVHSAPTLAHPHHTTTGDEHQTLSLTDGVTAAAREMEAQGDGRAVAALPPAAVAASTVAGSCGATANTSPPTPHHHHHTGGNSGGSGGHPPHSGVVYFGDHIHGDVVAPTVQCAWLTVGVVEEMGEVVHHTSKNPGVTAGAPLHGWGASDSPAAISGVAESSPCVPFSDGAEVTRWGSFFSAGGDDSGVSPSPSSSYFGWLLSRHATACVEDVEAALERLLPCSN